MEAGRNICGHPEKFQAAAILSFAPYNFHLPIEDSPLGKDRMNALIENCGGMEHYLKGPENVWDKLPGLMKEGSLPKLYFPIGKKDFLYPHYQKFRAFAEQIGLEALFQEFEGYEHDWRFWDLAIQKTLDYFGIQKERTHKQI